MSNKLVIVAETMIELMKLCCHYAVAVVSFFTNLTCPLFKQKNNMSHNASGGMPFESSVDGHGPSLTSHLASLYDYDCDCDDDDSIHIDIW